MEKIFCRASGVVTETGFVVVEVTESSKHEDKGFRYATMVETYRKWPQGLKVLSHAYYTQEAAEAYLDGLAERN